MTDFYDEYGVVITAPARLMHKYLRFSVYNLIFTRGIPMSGGYGYFIESGVQLIVPMKAEIRSFIDMMIQKVQDWVDKKRECRLTLFIYNVETYRIIERWVFLPISQGQSAIHTMTRIQTVLRKIDAKIHTLPTLMQPCYFLMAFQC